MYGKVFIFWNTFQKLDKYIEKSRQIHEQGDSKGPDWAAHPEKVRDTVFVPNTNTFQTITNKFQTYTNQLNKQTNKALIGLSLSNTRNVHIIIHISSYFFLIFLSLYIYMYI